jgi:hypothetical protein
MKRILPAHLPKVRVQGLVIDELPNEVLVYDLDRHKAHCLNQTAALVWQRCDGKSTAAEIARHLSTQLDAPFDEEMVWLALRQLDQLDLLEYLLFIPPQFMRLPRRAMIRNLGLAAAVMAPLVTSIVAPTAAEAATCLQTGRTCSGTIRCCSVLGCNPLSNTCR